jgi:hypothetical protein
MHVEPQIVATRRAAVLTKRALVFPVAEVPPLPDALPVDQFLELTNKSQQPLSVLLHAELDAMSASLLQVQVLVKTSSVSIGETKLTLKPGEVLEVRLVLKPTEDDSAWFPGRRPADPAPSPDSRSCALADLSRPLALIDSTTTSLESMVLTEVELTPALSLASLDRTAPVEIPVGFLVVSAPDAGYEQRVELRGARSSSLVRSAVRSD